jgi:hypothetical protein
LVTTAPGASLVDQTALSETRLHRVFVALLVVSLFAERWEKDVYLDGQVAIPNVVFTAVAVALAVYVVAIARSTGLSLRQPDAVEAALLALVALLGVLSGLALIVGPAGTAGASQSTKTFAHVVFLLGVALLLGRSLSRGLVVWALRVFLVVATACCVLAILQALDLNVVHSGLSTRWLHLIDRRYAGDCNRTGYLAPVSIFSEPAYLGYSALAAILAIIFLLGRSVRAVAMAVVCAAALVLSVSAGALVLAFVLGIYLFIRYWARELRSQLLLAGIVVAVVFGLGVGTSSLGDVLTNRARDIWRGTDPSAQYRGTVDEASVKIWHDSPLVGVGLGNSRRYLPGLVHLWFMPNFVPTFSDSSAYFNLLGESGPLAVLALVLVLGVLYRRRGPPDAAALLTQTLVLLVALECAILGLFLQPIFWFLVGLRLAASRPSGAATDRNSELVPSSPLRGFRPAVAYYATWLGVACAVGVSSTILFLHEAHGVTNTTTATPTPTLPTPAASPCANDQ